MTIPKKYLNASEALDLAFDFKLGKTLYKRKGESIDICSGGNCGFYWGLGFGGRTKCFEIDDKLILLWLGCTCSREGDHSFPSLWYQQTKKSDNRKKDLFTLGWNMKYEIDKNGLLSNIEIIYKTDKSKNT